MEPPIFTFIKSERHSTFVDLIYESGQFGACGSSFFVDSDIGFLTESTNLFFNKIPNFNMVEPCRVVVALTHTHTRTQGGVNPMKPSLTYVR